MVQQRKLVKALGLSKPSEEFTVLSKKKDIQLVAEAVSKYKAQELEELAFACGATGW